MADLITTDYTTDPPTVTERDYTPEELAQIAQDAADLAAAQQAAADAAALLSANAAAAIDHAKSLGFTDAMISAMYPNLVQP